MRKKKTLLRKKSKKKTLPRSMRKKETVPRSVRKKKTVTQEEQQPRCGKNSSAAAGRTASTLLIQQRALVALIRIAHGRMILRFIYAIKRISGTRQEPLALILLA